MDYKIKFFIPSRENRNVESEGRIYYRWLNHIPRKGDLVRIYQDGKIVKDFTKHYNIFEVTEVLFDGIGKNENDSYDIICKIEVYQAVFSNHYM